MSKEIKKSSLFSHKKETQDELDLLAESSSHICGVDIDKVKEVLVNNMPVSKSTIQTMKTRAAYGDVMSRSKANIEYVAGQSIREFLSNN